MRIALLLLAALALEAQQPASTVSVVGTATRVTPTQITIRTGAAPLVLYATPESKIWRGTAGNKLSVVQPDDKVTIRYQVDSAGHATILELYANLTHIVGRIISVSSNTFELDQNDNADPQSAYVRQRREILFDANTQFELSAAEDLRPGRTVDVIALTLSGSQAQASRITVSEGNKPVGMPAGARTILPDGTVR